MGYNNSLVAQWTGKFHENINILTIIKISMKHKTVSHQVNAE